MEHMQPDINKSSTRIEVRRLNNDELFNIKTIQIFASELLKFYDTEYHKVWLERALSEVVDRKRIAFGAFLHDENATEPKFIGSAVIKRATKNLSVEIKNLVIDSNFPEQIIDAQKQVLLTIERFCSSRGFEQMEIEFPAELTDHIAFFIGNHYKVSLVLESRYKQSDYHYLLTKKIKKNYAGDPFNKATLSAWLIGEYFGFKFKLSRSKGTEHATFQGQAIRNTYEFIVAPLNFHEENKLYISGACLYDIGKNEDITDNKDYEFLIKSNYDFKLYFSDKLISDSSVKVIDVRSMSKSFGEDSTIAHNTLSWNDVSGLMLTVGTSFKDRILAQSGNFFYIIGSGFGYALEDNFDLLGTENCIVAFCDERIGLEGNSEHTIWGYATLENINIIQPGSVYEYVKGKSDIAQIWTDRELTYFTEGEFNTNYNQHRRVSLLVLKNVRILKEKISARQSIDTSEVFRHYINSYKKTGITTCYLDKETTKKISNLDSFTSEDLKQNIDEMITETIVQAIDVLSGISTVVGFAQSQRDRWKHSLEEKKDTTEEKVKKSKRYADLVDATNMRLDDAIKNYVAIIDEGGHSEKDINIHLNIVCQRALKVLESLESFKEDIVDFDSIQRFFVAVSKSL